MCGWYNRCSGGHFAFCIPPRSWDFRPHSVKSQLFAAETAVVAIETRCTFDLINCTLCRFSHRQWVVFVVSSSSQSKRNIFKPSAPQLDERSPSSEPTLHLLYSRRQQNVSKGKVSKQQSFLSIAGSQFFTKSECESVCLPPLQFVAFVKFHIRPQSAIPQRNDQ